jgi:hypothetical protein
LRYVCSPQHTDSAFFPIIGQIERAARLARDDSPKVKLDKLDAILAQSSTSANDAALFASNSRPGSPRQPVLADQRSDLGAGFGMLMPGR